MTVTIYVRSECLRLFCGGQNKPSHWLPSGGQCDSTDRRAPPAKLAVRIPHVDTQVLNKTTFYCQVRELQQVTTHGHLTPGRARCPPPHGESHSVAQFHTSLALRTSVAATGLCQQRLLGRTRTRRPFATLSSLCQQKCPQRNSRTHPRFRTARFTKSRGARTPISAYFPQALFAARPHH